MAAKVKNLDQIGKFENPERYYVADFVRRSAKKISAGSSILDAGAGECVYKKYFDHCKYTSTDYCVGDGEWDYSKIDIVCKLSEIPIADESFDNVLCTQTLEHVPNPDDVLKELSRVTKKGGKLFLTVPLFHAEHQIPYDFYRYTQYGLKYLLEKNSFEIEKIENGGGYLLVSAHFLKHMPALIFKNKYLFFIKWPMLVLTNLLYKLFILLDDNNVGRKNAPTFNYLVTAVKK